MKLRAQLHFEIAKAEEANDFINKALEEGKKRCIVIMVISILTMEQMEKTL